MSTGGSICSDKRSNQGTLAARKAGSHGTITSFRKLHRHGQGIKVFHFRAVNMNDLCQKTDDSESIILAANHGQLPGRMRNIGRRQGRKHPLCKPHKSSSYRPGSIRLAGRASAAHLAIYADLAPVTRCFGPSRCGEHPPGKATQPGAYRPGKEVLQRHKHV